MECSEFEAILQDRLDRRLPLPLSAEARAHLRVCLNCELDYRFFQQLAHLTQEPMDLFPTAAASTDLPSPQSLEHVIGRCVAALGDEALAQTNGQNAGGSAGVTQGLGGDQSFGLPVAVADDDRIPTAQWVRLPAANGFDQTRGLGLKSLEPGSYGRRRLPTQGTGMPRPLQKYMPLVAAIVAALLLVSVGWVAWRLTPMPAELARPEAESTLVPGESIVSRGGTQRLAQTQTAPLASDDLRELARNWDDSVVAFDRGWQQMAAGRVRAHQIPGMQPAVYPITGAVEAFRKTWIRRNPDGLAAGLQW